MIPRRKQNCSEICRGVESHYLRVMLRALLVMITIMVTVRALLVMITIMVM